MQSLKDRKVVVTGGSGGLGLGVVEALVEQGAKVTVVARREGPLAALAARLPVATVAADVTVAGTAETVLGDTRPDILVLNAGAIPPMAPLAEMNWEDFSLTWNVDVKAGLLWMQAALRLPLASGSRVLVGSSGAAVSGSPLSGGYAGAKRMLWIMAKYANGVAQEKHLGIRFQAVVPMQMFAGTGVGQHGAEGYAQRMGISPEEFLAGRFPTPLTPAGFGREVVSILTDARYDGGLALGIKGGEGILTLEEAAA
jgi:NAD(P)-dependent dehydrogenase (short-subunit alcohol dehydrogenase family)